MFFVPELVTSGAQYIVTSAFTLRDRDRYKMACTELCGGVHTALKERAMKFSIRFCGHVTGNCIGLGVGQCE